MSLNPAADPALTPPQIVARLSAVSSATANAATEQNQQIVRPIGLAVAFASNVPAFLLAAKIVKSPSVRAFNALNFQ
jgi:hypothetical protein